MKHNKMEKFTPQNATILLVDHQDTIVSWIHSLDQKTVVNNVKMIGKLANELDIPVVVTSTREDHIGPNIKQVQETVPTAFENRIKRGGTLCAFDDADFVEAVKAIGRKNLIISGLTTDVCLFHTSVGALREGYNVQVVADACGSGSTLTDQLTFERLRALGVTITGSLTMLTELYTDFSTPDGKKAMEISMSAI